MTPHRWWIYLPLSILILLYVLIAWSNPFPLTWGDTWIYLSLANELQTRGEFQYFNIFTVAVPPLYPLWISPFAFFSESFELGLLIIGIMNSLGWVLVLPLTVMIGRQLGISPALALIAWIPIGTSAFATQYIQDVMSESIAVPLNLALFLSLLKQRGLRDALLAGVLGALCIMTKPLCLGPVILALTASQLVQFLKQRDKLPTTTNAIRALLFLTASLVLPIASTVLWFSKAQTVSVFHGALAGSYQLGALLPTLLAVIEYPEMLLGFAGRFGNLLGYTVLSLGFLPLLLIASPSVKNPKFLYPTLIGGALWSGYLISSIVFQEIYFSPGTTSYHFYGRYLDCSLPIVALLACSHLPQITSRSLSWRGMIVFLGILAIWLFPIEKWNGLQSIGVSGWYYLSPNAFFLGACALLLLTTLVAIPRHLVFAAGVFALSVFGAFMENERVTPHKTRWRDSVVWNRAYLAAPPEAIDVVYVDPSVTNRKVVWYWLSVYMHSRKELFTAKGLNRNETSIALAAPGKKIRGHRICGKHGSDVTVWCSKNLKRLNRLRSKA